MPPLPLSPIFQEASNLMLAMQRRAKDLETFQIPRLRDCKASLAVQQQYAGELREDVDGMYRQLETLDSMAEDQESQKDIQTVRVWVNDLSNKLSQLRQQGRTALLASKRAIDASNMSNREALLRKTGAPPVLTTSSQNPTADDVLMTASNNVTDALRRTTKLMQAELERSVLSHQMLDESTRTMQSTSDLYTSFSTLLTTSKSLVTALEHSDWLDRLLILSSLSFFLLVIGYIIKKRVIDKGLWLMFWWTKYLPALVGGEEPEKYVQEAVEVVANVTSNGMVGSASVVQAVGTTAVVAMASVTAATTTDPASTSTSPVPDCTAPDNKTSTFLSELAHPSTEADANLFVEEDGGIDAPLNQPEIDDGSAASEELSASSQLSDAEIPLHSPPPAEPVSSSTPKDEL